MESSSTLLQSIMVQWVPYETGSSQKSLWETTKLWQFGSYAILELLFEYVRGRSVSIYLMRYGCKITQTFMCFVYNKAPGVSKCILRAEHETFHHVRFWKRESKDLKITFLPILKNCRAKHWRAIIIAIISNLQLNFAL